MNILIKALITRKNKRFVHYVIVNVFNTLNKINCCVINSYTSDFLGSSLVIKKSKTYFITKK